MQIMYINYFLNPFKCPNHHKEILVNNFIFNYPRSPKLDQTWTCCCLMVLPHAKQGREPKSYIYIFVCVCVGGGGSERDGTQHIEIHGQS